MAVWNKAKLSLIKRSSLFLLIFLSLVINFVFGEPPVINPIDGGLECNPCYDLVKVEDFCVSCADYVANAWPVGTAAYDSRVAICCENPDPECGNTECMKYVSETFICEYRCDPKCEECDTTADPISGVCVDNGACCNSDSDCDSYCDTSGDKNYYCKGNEVWVNYDYCGGTCLLSIGDCHCNWDENSCGDSYVKTCASGEQCVNGKCLAVCGDFGSIAVSGQEICRTITKVGGGFADTGCPSKEYAYFTNVGDNVNLCCRSAIGKNRKSSFYVSRPIINLATISNTFF